MAKVRNNPIVRGISGSIGNLVFRQMPDGNTYVSGKQDFSRRKFSQKQKDHQIRFQRAVCYAREAARSHPIYAQIAKERALSPYNIALADWWNAPVIHKIEREGGRIHIWASDSVMVTKVQVMVLDEEGGIREKGEGIKCQVSGVRENWWEYTPTAEGRVVVEARDLAGNVTRAEMRE